MKIKHIDIGREFARALGPRWRKHGPHSGEEFREAMLEPAFVAHDLVVVELDSFTTYSASFFEEAFGGLVRKFGFESVFKKVRFAADKRAYLVPKLEAWMQEAGQNPTHDPAA